MNTIRTTTILPQSLLERARFFAREQGQSVSDLVAEGLQYVLEQREQQRLEQMYAGLRELQGFIKSDITDASTTIDEVLYGENGAWKGMRE